MNELENLKDDLNDNHKEFKCLKQDGMWQNGRVEMENRIIKIDDCLTSIRKQNYLLKRNLIVTPKTKFKLVSTLITEFIEVLDGMFPGCRKYRKEVTERTFGYFVSFLSRFL